MMTYYLIASNLILIIFLIIQNLRYARQIHDLYEQNHSKKP